MYHKLQLIEVVITDLAEKNQCFGKLDDGMSVFVTGIVAIGDIVEAEVYKIKKNYLMAKLIKILKPAETRIKPICNYFGICGGCKWQHLNYDEQLRLKQKQVDDALKHIGKFQNIQCDICIGSKNIFNYRNKVDFSFTDMRYLTNEELMSPDNTISKPINFALGFHASGFYSKALDIDHCYLATQSMNKILNLVRSFCLKHHNFLPIYSTRTHEGELRNLIIRHSPHTSEIMVNLVTTNYNSKYMDLLKQELKSDKELNITTFINSTTNAKNNSGIGKEEYILEGNGYIIDRIGKYSYQVSPNSFFQTNTEQAEVLYRNIINIADIKSADVIYDLFCGTGSITLFASEYCNKILGIEIVDSSIKDANINAKRNNVKNCKFIKFDIKDIKALKSLCNAFSMPDIIITDPPRAGMHQNAINMIHEWKPRTIVYVSCNPSSLARDGALICKDNQYQLTKCIPIDLFPQTNHVESIAKFERI